MCILCSPVQAGEVVYAGGSGFNWSRHSGMAPQTLSAPERWPWLCETVISAPIGHVRALSTGDLLWEYETPARVALTCRGSVLYSLYALNAVSALGIHRNRRILFPCGETKLVYVSGHIEFISHVFALDSSTGSFLACARKLTALDPSIAPYTLPTLPRGEDGPVDGVSALDAETWEILCYHTDVGHAPRPWPTALYMSPTENYYDASTQAGTSRLERDEQAESGDTPLARTSLFKAS